MQTIKRAFNEQKSPPRSNCEEMPHLAMLTNPTLL